MAKLPGANALLHRLQSLGPLLVYFGVAAVLIWTAATVYLGAVAPLAKPPALDPSLLFSRGDKFQEATYNTVTEHFPATARPFTAPSNPFSR